MSTCIRPRCEQQHGLVEGVCSDCLFEEKARGHHPDPCGRLLVGQGGDTWDPVCTLPTGHSGSCLSLFARPRRVQSRSQPATVATANGSSPHDDRVLTIVLVTPGGTNCVSIHGPDASALAQRIEPLTRAAREFWRDIGREPERQGATAGGPVADESVQKACPTYEGHYVFTCPKGHVNLSHWGATCTTCRDAGEEDVQTRAVYCFRWREWPGTAQAVADRCNAYSDDRAKYGGCGHCAERTRRGCPHPDTLPCVACPKVHRSDHPWPTLHEAKDAGCLCEWARGHGGAIATFHPACPILVRHKAPSGGFEPHQWTPEPLRSMRLRQAREALNERIGPMPVPIPEEGL